MAKENNKTKSGSDSKNKYTDNTSVSLKHVEKNLSNDKFASIANISEKIVQINNPILNDSTFSALEKATFNYESLLKSSSTLADKIRQINIDKVALSQEALLKSVPTLADKINQIDINKLTLNQEALLKSVPTLADKINQININTLTMKYSLLNNSIASLGEKLSKNSYSSLNDSVISLGKKLSKISISENAFRSFMDNFEKLSDSTYLEEFDLTSISYEDSQNIKSSSKEIIEKIITGTLEYSDVQNNRPKIYCIIIIKSLLTFILTYMLTIGLDSLIKNSLSNNPSSENISFNSIGYENNINLKIITTDNLNVRNEPSTKAEILYQLEILDIVCVINEQPYWYEIQYIDLSDNESKTGWIAKKYTKDYFSTLDYYSEYFSK